MAIRVVHQLGAGSLAAPYAAGVGRGRERRSKYALDMWQRNRYLQARFGGMGGRRARGAADEVQGRWLENPAALSAAHTVEAARQWEQAGQPLIGEDRQSVLDARKTLRQQKAQQRRAARQGRLGVDSGRFRGDLLPMYQSPEDIAALEQEQEWRREDDIRQQTQQHQIDMLQRRTDAEGIQGLGKGIVSDEETYSPDQRQKAQAIVASPELSPEEKYTQLLEISNNPEATPRPDHIQRYMNNTRPFDITTMQPAMEGDIGANVMRLPVTKDGDLDEEKAQKWIATRDAAMAAQKEEAEKKAKAAEEAKSAKAEADTAVSTAESALLKAQVELAKTEDPANKLQNEKLIEAQQKQVDFATRQLEAATKARAALGGAEEQQESPPTFATDAEADAAIKSGQLKPGDKFIGPDGKEHILQ